MPRALSTFLMLLSLAAWAGAQQPPEPDLTKIHREAYEQPFDEARFKAYLKELPRDGGYYIIEGDIALTEDEVRGYLVGKSESTARADSSAELLLNINDGKRDFYESLDQRSLTYAVDRSSFPSEDAYNAVVENVGKAASEWEAICPDCRIKFNKSDQISSSSSDRVNFIIRYHDTGGAYIALAFFPHDPPLKRVLRVDPTYFTTSLDRVGVFRHELGHILGYRHEQIRGIAGCRLEDQRWIPLTDYDPHSVMHYFCGGGGSLKLEISQLDRQAHSKLYAPPAIAGLTVPPADLPEKATQFLNLYRATVANPFDATKRTAFLHSLPRQGDYYILEGDLRMNEDEVLSYLVAQRDAPAPVERGAELLVNLHAGARDFYRNLDQRKLTYAVDRRSFLQEEQYKTVVEAMQKAAKDWVDACSECKVQFVHVKEQDAAPSQSKVNFTVRYQDSHGQYIAMSFFPHDPPLQRYLEVDPTYFTTQFDKVGVLRHELGHILGYRHEHIRGVPGCYLEDNTWQPLTPYDSNSVMHYFCGGKGNIKLGLTELDREGHHRLYGPLPPAPKAGSPALVVRFEGGEVSENILRVFWLLYKAKLLPLETHTVAPGESFEAITKEHLQLPGYPEAMNDFARRLNGGTDLSKLQIGDQVRYPNVRLIPYEFGIKLDSKNEKDRQQIAQIEEKWQHIFVGIEKNFSDRVRVTLKGYELAVPVRDFKQLSTVADQINGFESKNIVVFTRGDPGEYPAYFGHHDMQDFPKEDISTFWRDRQAEMDINVQGSLASFLGVADLPKGWDHPCEVGQNCPEIVLIDNPVSPHQDLAGIVFTDSGILSSGPPLVVGQKQKIEVDNEFQRSEHGTHLAGIIASNDNNFGLVGIHPGVHIHSWNWNEWHIQQDKLERKIYTHQRDAWKRGALQIYVFASEWDSSENPDRRLSDDGLATEFVNEELLLVAAAGQAKPQTGEVGENLTTGYRHAPMNLGDKENVLIVTECLPCEGTNPHIAPRANYSTSGVVHLAAPGENIPSTTRNGHYAVASGTSQATAFVAGVASAMACYYPHSYELPHQLKTRLQVTSRPLAIGTGSLQEATKVATGILDARLAMLDPTKDWIQKNGQGIASLGEPFLWEVRNVTGRNSKQKEVSVPLSTVYRIIQENGKVVFYVEGDEKGEIQRIGPLKLSNAEISKSLFLQGVSTCAIKDFEDLLLSSPHEVSGNAP